MQPTEIIMTNILPTGTGFAVLADDMNQSVFVPSKNIADMGLRPSDKVFATIVPNATHGHKTPWLAIAVHRDTKPALPALSVDAQLVLKYIEEGLATPDEIGESLNISDARLNDALAVLVERGKIVKVECYDLPGDAA